MAVEAELKLALPPAQRERARQVLADTAGGPGQSVRLSNVYYDTPSFDLKRLRSALRIRLAGDRWLQTFKSGGGAQGGLHRRHEWEMPVAGDALDADALIRAIEHDLAVVPETASIEDQAERDALSASLQILRGAFPTLEPLFRTDFTRTIWNIEDGSDRIEIGLDEGDVIVGEGDQRRTTPILEVELELKQGDEAALHRVAARLAKDIPGLESDNVSKAERGFKLREAARR